MDATSHIIIIHLAYVLYIYIYIYTPFFNFSSLKQLYHIYLSRALFLGFLSVRRTETLLRFSKVDLTWGIGYTDGRLKENIEVRQVVTSESSTHPMAEGMEDKRF